MLLNSQTKNTGDFDRESRFGRGGLLDFIDRSMSPNSLSSGREKDAKFPSALHGDFNFFRNNAFYVFNPPPKKSDFHHFWAKKTFSLFGFKKNHSSSWAREGDLKFGDVLMLDSLNEQGPNQRGSYFGVAFGIQVTVRFGR